MSDDITTPQEEDMPQNPVGENSDSADENGVATGGSTGEGGGRGYR